MPTEYVVTHKEDLQPGLEIVTVSAASKSLCITYSILSDTVADKFFRIEVFTGRIYFRKRFTSAPQNRLLYDFVVTARDNRGTLASGRVKVRLHFFLTFEFYVVLN